MFRGREGPVWSIKSGSASDVRDLVPPTRRVGPTDPTISRPRPLNLPAIVLSGGQVVPGGGIRLTTATLIQVHPALFDRSFDEDPTINRLSNKARF